VEDHRRGADRLEVDRSPEGGWKQAVGLPMPASTAFRRPIRHPRIPRATAERRRRATRRAPHFDQPFLIETSAAR